MKRRPTIEKSIGNKRTVKAIVFSAAIGVTFWINYMYQIAFQSKSAIYVIGVFFLTSFIVRICGGKFLDHL